MPEYREFLKKYKIVQKDVQEFLSQAEKLTRAYKNQLPIYLIARCPICGEALEEPLDIYSLNGIGWGRGLNSGYGWMDSLESYQAKCNHVVIISLMVNLNGIQPDDVSQTVWLGSERPFIMPPVLKLDQTYAVIHATPIGRYDDAQPQSHYSAYFVSYFTNVDKNEFDKVMQPAYESYTRVPHSWADYDLVKWVNSGKLYWLDRSDPEMSLRNQPISEFPYSNIKGGEGIWVIRNGRMEPYCSLKPVPWSGGVWQPEPGFFRRLINTFRTDKQDKP